MLKIKTLDKKPFDEVKNTKRNSSSSSLWVGVTILGIAAISMSCKEDASLPKVVNGSFEEPVVAGNWTTYRKGQNNIPGWSITSGDLDLINKYWDGSDGQQSIDMNGGSPVTIEQTLGGFTAGANYVLKFDYGVNKDVADTNVGNIRAEILIDGESKKAIAATTSIKPPNYQTESITFEAANEEVTFTFKSVSPGNKGIALDNVRLELTEN